LRFSLLEIKRADQVDVLPGIGNHTFLATGITAYLKNSGKLEVAQQIANHESPRTPKLYDRRTDEISPDEVERIAI
jgi:integrase/recombinase XerD